jgi:hypothetical protein
VCARVYQDRGWPFLFKGLLIGTCPYFDADAATHCKLSRGHAGGYFYYYYYYYYYYFNYYFY